jgi:hypothetical protein
LTYLDKDLKEALMEIARRHGVSVSEYVRTLILSDPEEKGIITPNIEGNKGGDAWWLWMRVSGRSMMTTLLDTCWGSILVI